MKALVITPNGMTSYFDIQAGVLQGDMLAPYLFIIAVDYCMRQAIKSNPEYSFTINSAKSKRTKADKISDLEFADDIALMADSAEEAVDLMRAVKRVSSNIGLNMNESKTKYMAENVEPGYIQSVSGKYIRKAENFNYLGSMIGSTKEDIQVWKAQAWAAHHKLQKMWTSDLDRNIKIRVFIAMVKLVLLYGVETWMMTKLLTKKIDGVYTRMLWMALNISWKRQMTNKELYGDLPRVSSKIGIRRMKLAGHGRCHEELLLNKLVLWNLLHG